MTLNPGNDVYENGKKMDIGIKFDQGKPDLSLNPRSALEAMARAFMVGEKKYGRDNYRNGMEASRYLGAALRHLAAFGEREDLDPEYKTPHLGHALASIAMLIECQHNGSLIDNRPPIASPACEKELLTDSNSFIGTGRLTVSETGTHTTILQNSTPTGPTITDADLKIYAAYGQTVILPDFPPTQWGSK